MYNITKQVQFTDIQFKSPAIITDIISVFPDDGW